MLVSLTRGSLVCPYRRMHQLMHVYSIVCSTIIVYRFQWDFSKRGQNSEFRNEGGGICAFLMLVHV